MKEAKELWSRIIYGDCSTDGGETTFFNKKELIDLLKKAEGNLVKIEVIDSTLSPLQKGHYYLKIGLYKEEEKESETY